MRKIIRLTSLKGMYCGLAQPCLLPPRTAYCHPVAWPPDNRIAVLEWRRGWVTAPADYNQARQLIAQ